LEIIVGGDKFGEWELEGEIEGGKEIWREINGCDVMWLSKTAGVGENGDRGGKVMNYLDWRFLYLEMLWEAVSTVRFLVRSWRKMSGGRMNGRWFQIEFGTAYWLFLRAVACSEKLNREGEIEPKMFFNPLNRHVRT
jgi:hypothetical protein